MAEIETKWCIDSSTNGAFLHRLGSLIKFLFRCTRLPYSSHVSLLLALRCVAEHIKIDKGKTIVSTLILNYLYPTYL